MEYREAIYRIKDHMRVHEIEDGRPHPRLYEALNKAIQALEEKSGLQHTKQPRMKPCPFCNDIWVYASDGDYYSGYEARGYKPQCYCGFAYRRIPWCETEEDMIMKWNTLVEKTAKSQK